MEKLFLVSGLNVCGEESSFLVPEDQLTEEQRARPERQVRLFDESGDASAYSEICMREFSHEFTVISVGKDMPSEVPLITYDGSRAQAIRYPELDDSLEDFKDEGEISRICTSDFKSRRVLNHYHPGYMAWASTFKVSPLDQPNLLYENQSSNNHIYLRVLQCASKQNYEPLFGCVALYGSSGHQVTRYSENFYFDATPDALRDKYSFLYGDTQRFSTEVLSCVLATPSDLVFMKSQALYLVFHVFKVLTSDADGMLARYVPLLLSGRFTTNCFFCRQLHPRRGSQGSPAAGGHEETRQLPGSRRIWLL